MRVCIRKSNGFLKRHCCVLLFIQWTFVQRLIQWKPLIMITLGPALFDNNNRLITLSGRFKYLHYLTQFIVTTFYMYKKQQVEFSLSSLLWSSEQLTSRKACFDSRATYLGHHYVPIQYIRRISSLDGNEVCQTSTLFNDRPVLSAESN